MRRRLTVILAADVAGYSRLVAEDEEDTIHRFKQAAAAFARLVAQHHGRIFNTAGDAILAEFPSALDATRCAIAVQDANNAQQEPLPSARQLRFRIGIAVGDVLATPEGDLLGDPVNIAARLESIAEPGEICISEDVRTHVIHKIKLDLVDLGEQSLRNIPRPIRAFKLAPAGRAASLPGSGRWLASPAARVWALCALVGLAAAVFLVASPLPWFARPQWFVVQGSSSSASKPRSFDASLVPFVTDRVRASLAEFERQPDFKAIAISHIGWGVASGAADAVSAEREAVDRCKKRDPKGDCRIYAVGNAVVAPPLPLPVAADLHVDPLDLPLTAGEAAGIKGMPSGAGLQAFISERDHKALAISDVGFSAIANRPDRAEAVRLAVERCSDFSRAACLLVAVDGFLTVRIPRAYRALRPYTLAGDAEMSDSDRREVGKIYAGRDWRALVRGGSHRWYAVSDMDSERAAVDGALHACRAAERDCSLQAVGNFRVEEPR
ncbi:MAG TPA: adenylate/guanylate cyclase domain-containing protein [Xanthobacteraceae bacterium]|nr:adenylate/guanylate cyclase domain-containing protein [Xanthobacteraceae bacterium]